MNETDFDPELAVADYRHIISKRDQATTELGREEFNAIALRMRVAWKDWQGEDSLREMAFSEILLPPDSP